MYEIIRFYANPDMTSERGVRYFATLEEAQAHCRDPEKSSETATNSVAVKRTEELGPWFEGYHQID